VLNKELYKEIKDAVLLNTSPDNIIGVRIAHEPTPFFNKLYIVEVFVKEIVYVRDPNSYTEHRHEYCTETINIYFRAFSGAPLDPVLTLYVLNGAE
jgi:hypothetical protein